MALEGRLFSLKDYLNIEKHHKSVLLYHINKHCSEDQLVYPIYLRKNHCISQ